MKHREIKNIIKNEYSGISILYDEVINNFKTENIHSFRIQVKQLRAFLRLASSATNEKCEVKLPKKLHEFYDAMGVIRSLQIQQEHFQKARKDKDSVKPEIYSSLLSTMIANNIAIEKDLAKRENPFKKGYQQLLSDLPDELKKSTIINFIDTRLKAIRFLLKPIFLDDRSLHSIRKMLTDFVYTWPYINIEFTLLDLPSIFSSEEDIIFITQLLGNFEDICVCLQLLHAEFVDCEFNNEENSFLRQMEKKWLIEKEIARERIHNLFQAEFLSEKKNYFSMNSIPLIY